MSDKKLDISIPIGDRHVIFYGGDDGKASVRSLSSLVGFR